MSRFSCYSVIIQFGQQSGILVYSTWYFLCIRRTVRRSPYHGWLTANWTGHFPSLESWRCSRWSTGAGIVRQVIGVVIAVHYRLAGSKVHVWETNERLTHVLLLGRIGRFAWSSNIWGSQYLKVFFLVKASLKWQCRAPKRATHRKHRELSLR